MIWLANINAGPISSSYGSDGSPTAIASDLSIAGQTWYVLNPVTPWTVADRYHIPRLQEPLLWYQRSEHCFFVLAFIWRRDHQFHR